MVRRKKPGRKWWQLLSHAKAMLLDPAGRTQLLLYAGVLVIGFAGFGIIDRSLFSPDEISDQEHRFGWNEALAKQESPGIAALMPKFAIRDNDGNVISGEGKSSELWKFAKVANGGKHIPTWKQGSGDCVSMGNSNAGAYLQGVRIGKDGRPETLKIPFPPHNYGASRVLIGKRQLGRGPGSIGGWGAQASISYGVFPVDEAERQGFTYGKQLADNWGWNGPPQSTLDYSKQFRIKTVSQVKTWDDLRDALVFGFPVTVASNVGFDGGSYDRDGKRWLRARGSWPHQMCFIGVEDRPGHIKGAYIINSWGADAHPKPLNDEPPGGFWVDAQTAHRMVSQGDSWAYSDFDGFPATDDVGGDWTAFKAEAKADPQKAELVARAEQPSPQQTLLETRKMFSLPFLYVVLIAGIGLFAVGLYSKYGNGKIAGTVGAILIAATFFGIGDRAEAGHRRRLQLRQQQFTANQCACPGGVCAAGQCATANCPNGQCGAEGQKYCVGGFCYPSKAAYEASVAKKSLRGEPANIPGLDPKIAAKIRIDWRRGDVLEVHPATPEEYGDIGPWSELTHHLNFVHGVLGCGDLTYEESRELHKRIHGIKDGVQVASEKLPADIFNAFGDSIDVSHTQAWTSMAPAKALRSYADCWEHEKDFVLVIGKETEAVKELERTDKPVAYEVSHKSIKPGAYRIFEQNGRLSIESLTQAKAVNVSSVAVRRQQ